MSTTARDGERNVFTPRATTFSASMSRPESVSSSSASVGSSTSICRISLRFFSPPEKPSLTERVPKVAILDETDSGLDIDALKIVSEGVNRFRAQEGKGVLLITHYTRILRYIEPDFVHVFVDGKVAESGGKELADQLEAEGYDRYLNPASA